ncbi:MAG TPA: protein-disulfide reductase DsbD N-terminal domain-containing protein [Pedobacter sp.]|jgi:DsbC/DsbD-like thiol-disulfide interchange protein
MKNLFLIALGLMLSFTASSQILKPVKWSYLAKKTSKTEATLLIRATIDNGWHIYSQTVPDGGPIKTSFNFKPAKAFSLVGKTVEPKPISKFEKTFDMNVAFFEKTVTFQQKVKLAGGKTVIKGSVEFMVCDDHQCLPPETVEFSIPVS